MPFSKPTPIDNEIILDPKKVIMSKTDAKGVIEFANDYFMEISGYEEYELMGKPHNVIRHPDMPKVIFKILWNRLLKGENIHAVVKNLAKDGSYYWVITNFQTKYDKNGNINCHYSHRKAAPKYVVKPIEELYHRLNKIEANANDKTLKKSLNYFIGYFEEKNTNYDNYILDLLKITEDEIQEYFTNPELNLNINRTERNKTTTKIKAIQKLKQIENEIRKLDRKIKEQEEKKKEKKKNTGFFSRLFFGI